MCTFFRSPLDTASLNSLRPISMDDLIASVAKMKASKVFNATPARFQ